MEVTLETKVIELNKEIEQLDIKDTEKSMLYKLAKGIMASPEGKVYTKNTEDYQEYLCFKIPNNTEAVKFCISKRVVEYSGATGVRSNDFPAYEDLIKYVNKHKKEIDAELDSLAYLQKRQEEPAKVEASDDIVERLIERVEKLPHQPAQKAQAIKVLESLATDANKKVYTVKEDTYEEYLSIKNNMLTVTQVMYDYAGAVQNRNVYLMKSKKLVEYVNQHLDVIKESLGKTK